MVGFSYSVSATELIYQEDADSHWCETGPFEENFTEYCYNMTDGDWDTGIHLWIENPDTPGHPLITEMDLYLEYEKPEGALSFSYWTLKSGAHLDYGNPAEFNLSFEDFPGCWDQETLELKAYIFSWFGHGGETTFFYCHDGNDWVNMNEDWGPLGSDANFYEDAMVWVVETPEASVNWSGVDLFGGGGLTTCPAGEGSEYSSLKVFVRDQNNESIEGIPAADFDFIVSDTFDPEYYGDLSLSFIPQDSHTDENGEISFNIVGDTSIEGYVLIFTKVGDIVLVEGVVLETNTYDRNLNGVVDIPDFSMFAQDYQGSNLQSDYNWDGIVDLVDLSMFASHYGHSAERVITEELPKKLMSVFK